MKFLAFVLMCSLLGSCRSVDNLTNYLGHYRSDDGSELMISTSGIQLHLIRSQSSVQIDQTDSNLLIEGWDQTYAALQSQSNGVYLESTYYNPKWDTSASRLDFIFQAVSLPENREIEALKNLGEVFIPHLRNVGVIFNLQMNFTPSNGQTCSLYQGSGSSLSFIVDKETTSPVNEIDAVFADIDIQMTTSDCLGGVGYEISPRTESGAPSFSDLHFKRIR